jgi:outer membrane protein TolC
VAVWKIAEPDDDKIRANCWEMYHDPNLNQLEEQVPISNQTIAVAEANFRAARATVVSGRSARFPTVTMSPSINNSRFAGRQTIVPGAAVAGGNSVTTPGTAVSGAAAAGASSYSYFSLPIDVRYTLDLWHRVRNNIAENEYTAQARAADVATALYSTHSELGQDYFEVRALDQYRAILQRTIENYRQSLELTKSLFRAGLASEEDVS